MLNVDLVHTHNQNHQMCQCFAKMFLCLSLAEPGETVASAQRVERQDGELHPQHQLHHLRRDPAGDEEGQSVPGAVRQGGRLQEPGTRTRSETLYLRHRRRLPPRNSV